MTNTAHTLADYAKVIRSKNSGPFELTFDVIFDEPSAYEHVRDVGAITVDSIANAYSIPKNHVLVCKPFDAAQAFKITIKRPASSGSLEDRDVYGCQQHVPLVRLKI